MGRALIILNTDAARIKAQNWIGKAPIGTRVTFAASKRTTPQNDRMWAMLTDVAEQAEYHGLKLTPNDWKLIFMDALNLEIRMVPNLDNTGFVDLGQSSSKLSKEEMSDLMELIAAYGAKHGVVFHDGDE